MLSTGLFAAHTNPTGYRAGWHARLEFLGLLMGQLLPPLRITLQLFTYHGQSQFLLARVSCKGLLSFLPISTAISGPPVKLLESSITECFSNHKGRCILAYLSRQGALRRSLPCEPVFSDTLGGIYTSKKFHKKIAKKKCTT